MAFWQAEATPSRPACLSAMTHEDKLPLDTASSTHYFPPFLSSLKWWERAVRLALAYAPNCILPALALSGANIVMLLGMHLILTAVNQSQVNLDDVIRAGCIGIGSLLVGLLLTCWSVGVWLFRFTAFAEALLTSAAPDRMLFAQSIAKTRKRAKYLAGFWFFVSLILLVPFAPLCAFVALKIIASPDYIGAGLLPVSLPEWVTYVTTAAIVVLTAVITAYSLVALVVSSVSALPPRDAAVEALRLSARFWVPLSVITAIVLLVNFLISSPQALFGFASVAQINRTQLIVDIGLQVWLGLTSAVIWPFSIVPFCELLRDKVK